MSATASWFASVLIVCSFVCWGEDQRKYQSSASLAFVRGSHWWPVDSPHRGPVMRKCFHSTTSWWKYMLLNQSQMFFVTYVVVLTISFISSKKDSTRYNYLPVAWLHQRFCLTAVWVTVRLNLESHRLIDIWLLIHAVITMLIYPIQNMLLGLWLLHFGVLRSRPNFHSRIYPNLAHQ